MVSVNKSRTTLNKNRLSSMLLAYTGSSQTELIPFAIWANFTMLMNRESWIKSRQTSNEDTSIASLIKIKPIKV